MKISRHYLTINGRRVHYRRCGSGPALLMIHQSPRSSTEYERLMLEWGAHFTCIAPDSPGYGNSDPLPKKNPVLADFGDAIVEFMDALGLKQTAAYGFHSGGAIAMNVHVRFPGRFTILVSGGYPIWSKEEMALHAAGYLPKFVPSAYGEHLTWLWRRIQEQTWFFPWFEVRDESRLGVAHDDSSRTNLIVQEMLDAGDNYRFGYHAVLQAPSDIPSPDTVITPAYIATYKVDPLFAQLDRLPTLPAGWWVGRCETPADFEESSLTALKEFAALTTAELASDSDAGFIEVTTAHFDGLIHWSGSKNSNRLLLHAPGQAMELLPTGPELKFDLPGHGLSSAMNEHAALADWSEVINKAIAKLGATEITTVAGVGISALLALDLSRAANLSGAEGIDAHIPLDGEAWIAQQPDLTPDRYGNYLARAWHIVRAGRFFWPWFAISAAHAIPFDPLAVTAESIAVEHRALMRARNAKSLTTTLLRADRTELVENAPGVTWGVSEWAKFRTDIWRP